jgi:hypothetical protein
MTEVDFFYSPPNEINAEGVRGEAGELLQLLIGRLSDGRRTLLPARVDHRTRWYGIASTDRDLRILMEEFSAWLGPPLSGSLSLVQTPLDAIDDRARQLAGGRTVIRAIVNSDWQGEARENVRSLVDIWTLTPERPTGSPRPVGRVLRYYYESLASADRVSALDALDEIRAGGLLSPANIRFLRVELLGRLGTPEELRDDPLLEDIALLRRPPAVSDHLAVAADRLFIPENAAEFEPERWTEIATSIESVWPGLIQHPSQVRSVAGARCLALAEHVAAHPRHGVIESLRSDWGADALVSNILDVLGTAASSTSAGTSVITSATGALEHFRNGDYERVLAAAEGGEVDAGIATAVMHAALNLGDAGSAVRALAIVDQLYEPARQALLAQTVEATFHAQLLERNQGNRVPDGWADWLAGDWPDRPDLLDEWCSSWDAEQVRNANSADKFAGELLDALNDQRRGRVRNGLPALVRWLVAEDGLAPSAVAIAVTIVEIMLGSDPGRAERRAALELVGEILATGCSADEYRDLTAELGEHFKSLGPRDVDWLTGVLDVFMVSATPDEAARTQLIGEGFGVGKSWIGRIDGTELLLLRKVLEDAGLELGRFEEPSDVPTSPEKRHLDHIGIYSLSESAARNAARWITEEWPNAIVELSHAHENSQELNGLASRSDVVLMQTSHAKHAATLALERSVEPARLIRVNGRGATSIFRALLDWSLPN